MYGNRFRVLRDTLGWPVDECLTQVNCSKLLKTAQRTSQSNELLSTFDWFRFEGNYQNFINSLTLKCIKC